LLKVYHSNALDVLRDVLVEMIAREPLSDPFCAEQILVQSPGMAQWLKLELADRLGIAANIEFPLPASFLWRTFSQLLVDVPKQSAYSKESMTWTLMRILPEHLSASDFQALKHYLAGDETPLRQYQLCEKIADLFDQYLVYRPDWIAQWERNDNAPADLEQLWQPVLWRALVADTSNRQLPHWHRANMYDAFIQAIASAPAKDIPKRLFVFGISALPENYLQALVTLGKRCDIHLMVANPCRAFWSDIVDRRYLASLARQQRAPDQAAANDTTAQTSLYQQGNPLLASMGKLGRDYLFMLGQMELPEVQLFSDDNHSSLLTSLQSDILSLRNRRAVDPQLSSISDDEARLAIAIDDTSVSLHSCHSAMREVQVLQDQLLAMLERDQDLEPRDIIVMMPDVSLYSPFVEAVFGQASAGTYLPFSISDRNAQQESPIIANFVSVLNLASSRYGASQLLELLSLPALLRRFELNEDKFAQLRHWILESGIKWGLDGQNRTELSLPDFSQNSWQFGLDRMFAGFALGDVDQTWQEIAPYSEIEGLDAAILGQLYKFVDLLQQCKQQFALSCPIEQWISFFNQLLNDLYAPDDSDLAALEIIYSALEKLQTTLQEVHYQQPIEAEIVLDYLQQSLTQQRSGQRFLSGQINFCTLMPMRAIPFKVVCLLGMNDGDYPRSVPPMGFDLMAEHSRKGDRSRRDDDRYLFLEALLSARSHLYISYVGRSIADNSHRAPSVLISELFEYAQQAYFLAESVGTNINSAIESSQQLLTLERQGRQLMQRLTTEHPLSPYHISYFNQSAGLFSYARQWLPIAELNAQPLQQNSFLQPLMQSPLEQLQLSALVDFYRQPIRYFFVHKLQVNFVDDETVIEDEEPFALSGLDNYISRDNLLKHALAGRDIESYSQYLSRSGLMPLGVAGDKSLAKNLHDGVELAEKIKPLLTGTLRRLAFDLPLQNLQLQGWIEPLYDIGVVKYSAANSSGRSYISTWIAHLASCANGCSHPTYFRAINEQFHFRPVPQEPALDYLNQLIAIYQQGLVQPLSWLPDLGWSLFNAEDLDKTRASLEKNYNQFNDPYIARVFAKWSDIATGLSLLNDDILAPLSEYLVIDTQEAND